MGEAALQGVRWLGAARTLVEVAALGSSVVLARLISPEDFGRAVIVLALITVVGAVFSEGFVAPLVQRAELDRRHLEVTAAMCVALSVVLGVFLPAVGWVGLGRLIDQATGELALFLLPAVVTHAVMVVPRAVIARRLDFRVLGIVELLPSAATVPLSIGLAVAGFGSVALVVGHLAGMMVACAVLIFAARPPRPRWHPSIARELVTFGTPTALASATHTGGRQAQFLLVGAALGPAQAGLFWRAAQLGMEYQSKVSGIMLKLALPLYARTSGLDEMKRIRGRIVRVHGVMLVPLLMLLVVTAPELVPLLYGDQWIEAIVPTQVLAFGGVAIALTTGVGPLLVASGHPRPLFRVNLLVAGILCVALLSALPFGLLAACFAVLLTQAFAFVYVHWWVLPRWLDLQPARVFADAGPAVVSSGALVAAGLAAAASLRGLELDRLLVLFPTVLAAGGAYLLALRGLFPAAWSDATLVARRVLPVGPRYARRRSSALT